MTTDNGGSPFDPNSTSETSFGDQRDVHNKAQSAVKRLSERGSLSMDEELDIVQFVSPTFPNSKYLVKPGKVETRVHPGGGSYMEKRDDDIWAKFSSGILTTDDQEVIDWAMAHTGDKEIHEAYHGTLKAARACGVPVALCMPEGPGVGKWAQLKELSISTATHDVQIPPEIDIDDLLKYMKPSASEGNSDMRQRAATNLETVRRRNEA